MYTSPTLIEGKLHYLIFSALGADHNMTRSVRRVLSDLEIKMKEHMSQHSNRIQSPGGVPYSTLSWRDEELIAISQKTAAAKKQKGHSNRPTRNNNRNGIERPSAEVKSKHPLFARQLSLRARSQSEPRAFAEKRRSLGVKSKRDQVDKDVVTEVQQKSVMNLDVTADGAEKENVNPDGMIEVDTTIMQASEDVKPEVEVIESTEHISTSINGMNKANDAISENATEKTAEDCPEYLDNYAEEPRVICEKKALSSSPAATIENETFNKVLLRPNSAIMKYSQQHILLVCKNEQPMPRSFSAQGYTTKHDGQLLERRKRAISATLHHQNCYIPGSHTIDIHNTQSVTSGTNSTIVSLLPKSVPRGRQIHHASAFYHVPGRYPTMTQPFPPKRSQSRMPLRRTASDSCHDISNMQAKSWPPMTPNVTFNYYPYNEDEDHSPSLITSMPNIGNWEQ